MSASETSAASRTRGGADPNAAAENGITPLMFAAASSDVASVQAPAARKVDLEAKEDVRGLTAVTFAAAENHAAVVTALGKLGADRRWPARVQGRLRPAIPTGGPGVPPLVAASRVGYDEGFVGNTHNVAPTGMRRR